MVVRWGKKYKEGRASSVQALIVSRLSAVPIRGARDAGSFGYTVCLTVVRYIRTLIRPSHDL